MSVCSNTKGRGVDVEAGLQYHLLRLRLLALTEAVS